MRVDAFSALTRAGANIPRPTAGAPSTRLLSETFEASGYDAAGWSETVPGTCVVDENATVSAAGSPVGWGSQCLRISLDGGGADCFTANTFGDGPVRFFAAEFRVTALAFDTNAQQASVMTATNAAGTAGIFLVQLVRSAGANFLQLFVYHNGSANAIYSEALQMNHTYRVECKWDDTANAWQLWLDNVSRGSGTLTGAAATTQAGAIALGDTLNSVRTATFYIDRVAVDSAARVQEHASIVHKGSLTVGGVGFGTKPAQTNTAFQNGDNTFVNGGFSAAWPTATGGSQPDYHTALRTPGLVGRGIPTAHSRVLAYICGAHNPGTTSDNGYNVAFWSTRTISAFPAYSYWSWYQRIDPGWDFAYDDGDGVNDDNLKFFGYSVGSTIYELPNNWYVAYNDGPHDLNDPTSFVINDDSVLTLQDPDQNAHSWFWDSAVNPMSTGWTKYEMELKYTDQNDGYIKVWENGVLKVDYLGRTDGYAGTTRSEGIGGYARNRGAANWRYFNDAFYDRDPKRFVLTDSPSYASSTKFEPQPYTAWADGSVTLKINAGALPTGIVHLHFRNQAGSAHQYMGALSLPA